MEFRVLQYFLAVVQASSEMLKTYFFQSIRAVKSPAEAGLGIAFLCCGEALLCECFH